MPQDPPPPADARAEGPLSRQGPLPVESARGRAAAGRHLMLLSGATARCDGLNEGQLGDVLFEDGRTVIATFGSKCERRGAGKPAALPAATEPGSGAALLVDWVRRATVLLWTSRTSLSRQTRPRWPPHRASRRPAGPLALPLRRAHGPTNFPLPPPRGSAGATPCASSSAWRPMGSPGGRRGGPAGRASSRSRTAASGGPPPPVAGSGRGAAACGRGDRGCVLPQAGAAAPRPRLVAPPARTVPFVIDLDVPDRALTAAFKAAGAATAALYLASPGPGDAPEHRAGRRLRHEGAPRRRRAHARPVPPPGHPRRGGFPYLLLAPGPGSICGTPRAAASSASRSR